ncbi:hypothetical protein BDZ94DRAFT_1273179 [Collybia nuda]|uniref:Uncharacterized protein n=1 Tax=Collybia nuda TaxID=64659 RepID=A0A9P6CDV9_9AGAR|nr:hypothetical protein BDZ94DRAFT_1273179 [Collybia nuda]
MADSRKVKASYPLDTIRRRMMMASGPGVNYKSMFDAGSNLPALVYCLYDKLSKFHLAKSILVLSAWF